MKKVTFIAALVLFVISAANLSVNSSVMAQTIEDSSVEMAPSDNIGIRIQNATTESARIDYELPFPGMLPDNPFYILKVLRDKIVKTLINNPLQEAKFNLLTSQKRMYAGKLLVDKKKYGLAIETIEKSNNYLLDALNAIKKAKEQNPKSIDIRPFLDQFRTVTLKHSEILKDIEKSFGKKYEEDIKRQTLRVEEIRKNVEILLMQK